MSASAGRAATKLAVARPAPAAHVTRIELVNNRLIGAAIEPRAVIAVADPASDSLTLYSSTQVPHHIRRSSPSSSAWREAPHPRLIAPDVGGGFGYKGKHYPEETILAWAARRLRRPVKWVATRSESFVSDYQGRDHFTHAELALDADGHFLALRVETFANLGAYVSTFGAAIPSAIYSALLAGVYRTPAVFVEMHRRVHQHGADRRLSRRRPAGGLLRARAACRPGRARARHRSRRDPPAQSDSGAGHAVQDADRPDLRLRRLPEGLRARARARRLRGLRQAPRGRGARDGRLRGIGIACYVESSGVAPSRFAGAARRACRASSKSAAIRVEAGRQRAGDARHPQSRPGPRNQLRADPLVAARRAAREDRDRRRRHRRGPVRHRHLRLALDRGRRLGARSAPPSRSSPRASGSRRTAGGRGRTTSRSPTALFASPAPTGRCPSPTSRAPPTCRTTSRSRRSSPGCRRPPSYDPSELRVQQRRPRLRGRDRSRDRATRLVGYWAVDDIGTVINPMIVEGQVHGGVAQGIGQALYEHCLYDADERPTALGLVHGLRAAARRRPAGVRRRIRREPALHAQPARRERLRRGGQRSRRRRRSSARCSMRCGRSA